MAVHVIHLHTITYVAKLRSSKFFFSILQISYFRCNFIQLPTTQKLRSSLKITSYVLNLTLYRPIAVNSSQLSIGKVLTLIREGQKSRKKILLVKVVTDISGPLFHGLIITAISVKIVQKFDDGPLLRDRNDNASFFESFGPPALPPPKRALWLNTMCAVKHNGVIIFRCGRRREICVLNEKVTNKQNSREFRQKHRGRVRTRGSEQERERERERDWRMKSTEHHRVCSEHAAGQVSIVKPHYRCNYQAKNIMWDGGVSECIQYRPPLYKVNPRVYVKVVRVTADHAAREGKRFVFSTKNYDFRE